MKCTFDKAIFAKQIKRIRAEHGITQEQFANEIGCGVDAVKKWESSKSEIFPKLENILSICSTFGTDPNSLIGGYEAYPPTDERISHSLGLS